MDQILNKVRDVDPNDSEALKGALTPFFQNLSKHKNVDCHVWLRTLEDVINRYPKYCTSHRVTIENYLVNFLNSTNYYHVIGAAKCAHAVQQVKPSQDKESTPKACWREQSSLLCNAAHSLIEALFSKTLNIYKSDFNTQKGDAKILTNMPLTSALLKLHKAKSQDINGKNKMEVLSVRLRNVFVFIQAMLVEIYPIEKPMRPQLVLEVIIQALSVSSGAGNDLCDVISVKTQALRTLDALVACLRSNLIPFSALVFRCVMQTLRWSSENLSEESSKVRCSAYNSLNDWLRVLHVHRMSNENQGKNWEDEITKHIVEDITPIQHIVQLTMRTQPKKNMSKKAKRRMANMMLQESSIASHAPGEKNKISISTESSDGVAIAALDCAETLFIVCGLFLKPTTHKMFQERLVRDCYNISAYNPERAIVLLRCLEAARKSTPPFVPPPTQYCLQLYSVLINSPTNEISKFSSQALLDIRLHLHCAPPSLNFAIEEKVENKRDKKRKRISERNRAVLEKLLGAERLPSEDQPEVISIADEPVNKKQCLGDDITEKISLSSASIQSVDIDEISDDSDVEANEMEADVDINVPMEDNDDLEQTIEESIEINDIEVNNEPPEETVIEEINQIVDEDIEVNIIPIVEDSQGAIEHNIDAEINTSLEININLENKEIEEPNTINEIESSEVSNNIFEANTQLPVNVSMEEDKEENLELSMEVGYGDPNTGTEKIAVIENLEGDTLPSTNDTDDLITCGQAVNSSQEVDKNIDCVTETNTEPNLNEVPIENGIDQLPTIVENGIKDDEIVSVKAVDKTNDVTVEDMLADFVDEVIEEDKTQE
ncbi:hypothetical protein K1T71_006318 [Dendrolimus kikuchii]|uniref:Uncharacterized protein n=1 Tax=Dendrolimus kikuchii TaxID=765133 RepID=A0ACC1D3U9_9NEOP|nr:hypothetical protein K1T71_006318 [Dendrolimus kikuchii]